MTNSSAHWRSLGTIFELRAYSITTNQVAIIAPLLCPILRA